MFSVLFSLEISFISMFMVMGFCLIKGLLNMMRFGFSVIVCVSVVRCVILLESLEGISLVVLCSFMVFSFIIIVLCNNGVGSWVCLCSG